MGCPCSLDSWHGLALTLTAPRSPLGPLPRSSCRRCWWTLRCASTGTGSQRCACKGGACLLWRSPASFAGRPPAAARRRRLSISLGLPAAALLACLRTWGGPAPARLAPSLPLPHAASARPLLIVQLWPHIILMAYGMVLINAAVLAPFILFVLGFSSRGEQLEAGLGAGTDLCKQSPPSCRQAGEKAAQTKHKAPSCGRPCRCARRCRVPPRPVRCSASFAAPAQPASASA